MNRCYLGVMLAVLLSPTVGCKGEEATAGPPPPLEVYVTEVVTADVPVVREWLGETRGTADIDIRARVQGYLLAIHFREGSVVQKGQPLYSIDPSELLQERAASEANLAAAKTQLAYADSDVARYRPLAEINAVSRRDLDSAVARQEAAQAQVEAAEALLRLAEINLSYCEIKAPISGVIGLSQAKVGDYVGQSPNPVVLNTISQTDPIHVRFPVGEREYLELARKHPEIDRTERARNEPAKVPLELILADGSLFPHIGRVEFVERNVNASTGTLTIEASFANPDLILRPGQYARVRAVIDTEVGARLVPQRAVQELQGQYQLWVVKDDGTVEARRVRMGRRVDRSWIVEQGVEPGEVVVVDGIQRLSAGARVEALPWEPPPTSGDSAAEASKS